jgi:hypothetical protein
VRADRPAQPPAGEVVPGSGSGGLDGLEGTAEIVVEDGVHRLVLEYGV